ncbi:MAG: hypothetical protein GXP08_10000 [Gammaproteobacteria bacterium]|nr:hypothetical protein [Gammaproteobacteria bacterium]
MNKLPINGIQPGEDIQPKIFKQILSGKKGIVLFKDYWQRQGENNPSGDHIDLWNGSRLTDWRTWLRIQMDIVIPGIWEDLSKSKKIRFWRVH